MANARSGPFAALRSPHMGRPSATPTMTPPGNVGRRALGFVFAIAVLAHAWTLALPFQFDDYALVGDPLSLFALVPAQVDAGESPFMLRWTLWLYWGLCAAVSGKPLSPVPFHLGALLLHGFVCVLLARLVARLAPRPIARRAAILAGLLFGVSGGGIAAVSWSAAQSDLLFPLFGLLAATAFLDARERAGRARATRLALALFWVWVALVSKAPAFLVPPVLGLLLWSVRPGVGGGPLRRKLLPRVLRVEWAVLASGLFLGLLSRFLYLGTFRLQYQEVGVPGPSGLPVALSGALATLGQALYPWNRSAVFTGDGPVLAELLFARFDSPPAVFAASLCGALLVVALVRAPLARRAILLSIALAVLCALPSGLLYSGQPTNVLGRTTYFPLLFALPALAFACAALLERRAVTGWLVTVVLGLFVIDATVHVARTELLSAAHHQQALDQVERARVEHERAGSGGELRVLAILPDNGLGGIPALGYRLSDACRPPFRAAPAIDVVVFETPEAALDLLQSGEDLRARDLALIGREWNVLPVEPASGETVGAAERERLRLRAWTPLRPGLVTAGAALDWRLEAGSETEEERWVPIAPVPAHALTTFWIGFEAGAAMTGELVLERAAGRATFIPLEVAASSSRRRVPLAPWLVLTDALGAPVSAVSWRAPGAPGRMISPPEPLSELPRLVAFEPPAGAEFDLGPTPPAFGAEQVGTAWCLPGGSRLELRQRLLRGPRTLFEASPADLPWAELVSFLEASIRSKARHDGEMDWRFARVHPGGHLAARSPFQKGRFVSLKTEP